VHRLVRRADRRLRSTWAAAALLFTQLLLVGCGAAGTGSTVESFTHGDGVIATSPAAERWADAVPVDGYQPGPEALSYTDPAKALGPASGVSTDVVVLGRGGSIVLDMATPFADGPGADFAVWENGIVYGEGSLFAELAFVEVSSDGTSFARFPTRTARTTVVGAYQPINPADYSGFAGLHPAGTGTAFDLAELRETPEVQSDAVDLTAIRFVRILDIVGDGGTSDSFGNPIYDPYPTTGTAGFDLDGVAVLRTQ
jgi:hypothetical protein